MGKGLLGPNGGSGGLIEGIFGESCGGNGGSMFRVGEGKVDSIGLNSRSGGLIEGRFGESCGGNSGSVTKVGEGMVDSTGGMGGGSLAIRSMVLNDGRAGGGLVVEGGEVNGGGVDLGVSKRFLLEVAREMIDESGGIEVGGGADT
nr:hypothetical protein [Tanacetum cinerariifolium]